MKVLTHGTGFAGIGQAVPFRTAGCDVVGIVGRRPDVVRDVNGEAAAPYPTFAKCTQYHQIIDVIRRNGKWTDGSGLT